MHSWSISSDIEQASLAAAEFLAEKITACIDKKGICHVALPGGNTPALCMRLLAEKNLPWDKVHWYLGDERCCPVGHEDRNDVMLQKNLWSLLPAGVDLSANIHPIPAELGSEDAADRYRELIDNIGCIDIAFLGMGEDGHTASLFPDNAALREGASVIPVHDSPKSPSDRVSLSIVTLYSAGCRLVLTAGTSKAPVIKRIRDGEPLPVNLIGDIDWFIDEAAIPE
jgi:6-phosphogluconolactonase